MAATLQETIERTRQRIAAADWQGARSDAETLLRLAPDDAMAIGLAALVLFRAGAQDRAIAVLRAATQRWPTDAGMAGNLANALQEAGLLAEALAWHATAVRLDPKNATLALNHGLALQAGGARDPAMAAFRQALALDPANDSARRMLAANLADAGLLDEARTLYGELLARRPEPALELRRALLLPPILPDEPAIGEIRAQFAHNVAALKGRGFRIASPSEVGSPSFFLAYHGENEVALQRQIADLYLETCTALPFVAPHCADPDHRQADGRFRIGFLSANLRTHTIGRLFGGLIGGLDPAKFETILFRRPQPADGLSRAIDASVSRVVPIATELAEAQRQIAALELDIMFYPDIGMDMATFGLAFARLAPVQCVAWGHPLTTGIPTLDYFLSWAAAEPADAGQHYTERLIRLQSIPSCYRRPAIDPTRVQRARFDLPADRTLYLCLQTLFKFHPSFDAALGAILRRDRDGLLLLIEGPRRAWQTQLMERLRRRIPDVADRIRFMPPQSNEDYLALTALADVVLDPPVFGGGNTTLEALAAGRPVVTLPGRYLRGRITQGFLRQIGQTGLIAGNLSEYADIAVAAAGRSRAGSLPPIAERAAALFDRHETIGEHERFFEAARAAARSGTHVAAWPE